MHKNAECYYNSALKLLLPIEIDPELGGFVISLGKKRYFFLDNETPYNNLVSVNVARNKYFMNQYLKRGGLPVPKAMCIHKSEFEEGKLAEIIAELNFPVVVKPTSGTLGKHVLCNLKTLEHVEKYMAELFQELEFLTVEEFHGNLTSYRVLIFNDRILDVVIRHPACVTGDGKHNLQELIDLKNVNRRAISETLKPIVVDWECRICLEELGLDLDYIPVKDEQIILGYTSNASRGGTYRSLGKTICKQNKKLLIRAAQVLGLKLVGFDIQCKDIRLPMETTGGVIIEANDGPSVRIHENPIEGVGRNVCIKILRHYIFLHPLAYMKALYRDARIGFYIRTGLIVLGLATVFKLMSLF